LAFTFKRIIGPRVDEMHFGPAIAEEQVETAVLPRGFLHLAEYRAIALRLNPHGVGEGVRAVEAPDQWTKLGERLAIELQGLSQPPVGELGFFCTDKFAFSGRTGRLW
jgi:hypothetical protein